MKKFINFCGKFLLVFFPFVCVAFFFYFAFELLSQGLAFLLWVRPLGTPLEGEYLNYMVASFAGSCTTMGLGLLFFAVYSLIRSLRYASLSCKSSAEADVNNKEC